VNRSIDRRSFLAGGAALALTACSKRAPSGTASSARPAARRPHGTWKMESFPASADIPRGERAMLLDPWPKQGLPRPEHRPLLVALHGRGESGPGDSDAGLEVGATAWPETYDLEEMNSRLFEPPLVKADLHGMTNIDRLEKLNASLEKKPYKGLGVACPFTPLVRSPMEDGFGHWVAVDLVRRLRDLTESRIGREGVGIDGVSMGGRLALFIGLMHPEVFGVVSALQPALQKGDAEQLSLLAKAARARGNVNLRLVTSDDDCFLGVVEEASERLRLDGVHHELLVIPGSHGYEFNRGPGGAEMLLWHERVQPSLAEPGAEAPDGG